VPWCQRCRNARNSAGSIATLSMVAPAASRSRTVGAMKPGIFEKPSAATRWLVSRMAGLPKRSSTTSR
jgi:hypothetical protein